MNKVSRVRALKLPFQFNESLLKNALEVLKGASWLPHFNKGGYEGNWTSIPLYAVEGDTTNIYAFQKDDTIIATSLLKKTPYFKEVIEHFKCEFASVRLLRLAPGSFIKPHTDYNLGYEDGVFRIHIPIVTNDKVKFILDDKLVKMMPGECWYTNVNFTHSVANDGEEDRIHLVIDGKRNSWSDDLFFSLTSKESLIAPEETVYDKATLQRIIEELERQNSPNNIALINDLKKQLTIIS